MEQEAFNVFITNLPKNNLQSKVIDAAVTAVIGGAMAFVAGYFMKRLEIRGKMKELIKIQEALPKDKK